MFKKTADLVEDGTPNDNHQKVVFIQTFFSIMRDETDQLSPVLFSSGIVVRMMVIQMKVYIIEQKYFMHSHQSQASSYFYIQCKCGLPQGRLKGQSQKQRKRAFSPNLKIFSTRKSFEANKVESVNFNFGICCENCSAKFDLNEPVP